MNPTTEIVYKNLIGCLEEGGDVTILREQRVGRKTYLEGIYSTPQITDERFSCDLTRQE